MTNLIVALIIILIISGAAAKIIIDKKNGTTKCIGCPYNKSNQDNCSCTIEIKEE
ncbi:MAG: hypothetical protein ACOCQA_03815 [bacterium]